MITRNTEDWSERFIKAYTLSTCRYRSVQYLIAIFCYLQQPLAVNQSLSWWKAGQMWRNCSVHMRKFRFCSVFQFIVYFFVFFCSLYIFQSFFPVLCFSSLFCALLWWWSIAFLYDLRRSLDTSCFMFSEYVHLLHSLWLLYQHLWTNDVKSLL